LTKAEWQPVLEKATAFITAWQKGMMAREGWLVLVTTVIAVKPIHQFLVAEAPVWLHEEIA
jgi:hypothetical protein